MQERLNLAISAAKEAAKITQSYFMSRDLRVDMKSDRTPVTEADKNTEKALREIIQKAFPDDGILGEEWDEKLGSSGYRWILDPIDGTKSFIHGVPLYGTLIAVEYQGESVIGVISIPATGEMVYAAIGHGCWYTKNGSEPVQTRVSQLSNPSEGLFLTSEVLTFDEINRRDVYEKLEKTFYLTRTWGDCYGYMLVATGRAECIVDPVLSIWDAAALLPVIVEAGGTFTDFRGVQTHTSEQAIATNGLIHDKVLELVK
ncbi:MAG: histidinol-phosphatase [Thermoguttaceae bacterium]|nr:histidinol-phosphatase [Thermoguttaceae bacterium]